MLFGPMSPTGPILAPTVQAGVPPNAGTVGQDGRVDFACCFCQETIQVADNGTLSLLVASASRLAERDAPTQELWCHATCLGGKLSQAVHFDPFLFTE